VRTAAYREYKRLFTVLIVLLGFTFVPRLSSSGQAQNSKAAAFAQTVRPFTVANSIESTHFVQPAEHTAEHPPVSPDGERFFVVTERGLLESNLREFSLLVFDFNRLREGPNRVAVFRTSSNRPGIDHAKWVGNETISLVGEKPGELPQVYVVNCASHKIRKVTSAAHGVFLYDLTQDLRTIVYYAYWGGNEAESKQKEEHGFAVTDESLEDLVTGHWKQQSGVQMFVLHPGSGKARPVKATPVVATTRLQFWLSPTGRYVVTCEPAFHVPEEWAWYDNPLLQRIAAEEHARTHSIRPDDIDQYMLVDTQTLNERPLLNAPVRLTPAAAWLPDGQSVVVSGTLLPLDTSDPEELSRRKRNPAAVEVMAPSLSFRRVIDMSKTEGWDKLMPGTSPGTFRVEGFHIEGGGSLIPFPRRQYRRVGEHWIEDASYGETESSDAISISEANDRWPKLVKVDFITQKEQVIFDPNPEFRNLRFGREEIVHWTGNLGEPLVGGLLYPPQYIAGHKYPLVIQTYVLLENAFLLDGPMTTAYAAQALVNHDVVVLQVGLSPLYEQTKYKPGFGKTELSQVDSAVEYLDKLGLIDTQRVGLIGFSAKGFQVLYALAHSKYRFAAATSAEGSDWGYWGYLSEGDNTGWALQAENQYGGPPWNGNWKNWMDDSITFSFDKIHTPLRLESDSNDDGAVINEWEKFIALRRLREPVELIFESHGAHPVVKPWDRMTSQQGNVDWLIFWLKGEEDPDPAKSGQYARWHELKKLQVDDVAKSGNVPP
jgi:dipeptidyl aminopeptidase/acylaminoacyl peptidase